MKRTIGAGLTSVFALALAVAGCGTPASQPAPPSSPSVSASATSPAPGATRIMRDIYGDVSVPQLAGRIATAAPAYTTAVLLLGGADKLVALEESYGQNDWIKNKYPSLADLPVVFASNETNMEALLATSPDLVMYAPRYGEESLKQLQDLGIAAISGAKDSQPDGYDRLTWVRDTQLYFGEAIGGAQLDNARDYATEFTAMREQIEAKTSTIKEADRPTMAVLASAGDTLQVSNRNAMGQALIDLAGGVNVARDAGLADEKGTTQQGEIDAEQLLAWNPQILMVNSPEIAEAIAGDAVLSGLDAVSSNRVYVVPNGAMNWGYFGPEVYLAMQYFAKATHPSLFTDLDLQANAADFYAKRFGFELSDADLTHLFNLTEGQTVADVFVRG
ncbi:MAG: ABC transporter substrate-binding protein [Propionicimonas sp.]